MRFSIISGFLYHEHRWYKTLKSFGIPVPVWILWVRTGKAAALDGQKILT